MIVSYRDKRSERFAKGGRVQEFSGLIGWSQPRAQKDLAALPGNRLESLKGSRQGQWSIRINDQWRICFEWPEWSPGPVNVEIVDYH
jgi:proteic killer suppression protein